MTIVENRAVFTHAQVSNIRAETLAEGDKLVSENGIHLYRIPESGILLLLKKNCRPKADLGERIMMILSGTISTT